MKKIIILIQIALILSLRTAIGQNYVKTETFLDSNGTRKVTSIQYFDGIGRPNLSATNGLNTINKYVYTLQTYDLDGKVSETWLPVYDNTQSVPTYYTYNQFKSLSSSTYYNDTHAYRKNIYDGLGRITAVDVEGDTCRNNGIQVKKRYDTNSDFSVKKYTTPVDGDYTLIKNGYHPKGSLTMEETEDEDGYKTQVYSDLRGLVVLERRIGDSENHDTYYVYNDLGQLRYVLTPEYQDDPHKADQGYEYRYDNRGRVIKKIMPDCNAIQFWYDNNNRLICVKDPNLTEKGLSRFMLYDIYGRLAIEGTCSNFNYNHLSYTVNMLTSGNGFQGTGYNYNYPHAITHPMIQKVYYYDNYNFLTTSIVSGSGLSSNFTRNNPSSANGLQTGNIIRTTEDELLFCATYYDSKGRPIDIRQSHINNRITMTTTSYSFTDKPTNITTTLIDGNSQVTLTENNTYSQNGDFLINTTLKWDNGTEKSIAQYSYDKLGRIITYTRGGSAGIINYGYNLRGWLNSIEGPGLTEKLYYADGVGNPCYNGNISSMTWKAGSETLVRGYKFDYDGFSRLTKASYGESSSINLNADKYTEQITAYNKNGSILGLKRYGMKNNGNYGLIDNLTLTHSANKLLLVSDNAGNLVYNNAFDFKDNTVSVTEYEYSYYDDGALKWDANKGISLVKYDKYGMPSSIQFCNGNITEYVYAADGSKLKVRHFTAMPNINVNLGSSLNPNATNMINYNNPPTIEYVGNFVFENGSLSRYLFAGGYCTFSTFGDQPAYHYYAQDHLGSNRAVINENGTIEQTTHYYAFGGFFGNAGYNPGFQEYKYNGKEYDNVHDLNWYDYGARNYDPAIGQFTTMDPRAEKYYNINTYAYCGNNPVNAIDPNGKEIWIHYTDIDGLKQSFQYFVGMKCNIDNADAQTIVSNLNEMYANEDGAIVLDALLGSDIRYGYMKADTYSEGGEGYYDYKTNTTNLNDVNNTLTFAEETFHMYQRVNNQGGKTDVNEVEAKLFSAKINLEIKAWNNMPYHDKIAGKVGSPYADSMANLLWTGYNDKDYKIAVDNFFSGSISGSVYKKQMGYVHGTIRKNPLIKKFLPTK